MSRPLLSQNVLPDAPVSRETAGVLGGALLGEPSGEMAAAWPLQRIFAPLLRSTAKKRHEIWQAGEITGNGTSEGIVWRRSDEILYGVIELDEATFVGTANASPLQLASREAYCRIFRLLDQQGLPHLWRIWNYLADINGESDGLERYRQFNIGRQDAFLECKRGATGNVPAACAIGLASGPLSIAFMAGHTPAIPIENPRQISAYNYPSEYGPRSPTFSRAALVYPAQQEILFISGTASIVGHQTVHAGDAAGQCRETLANIAAILNEANRRKRSAPYQLDELSYRIYVRHVADLPLIENTLTELAGEQSHMVFVQADICRHDLLLEIEAMAVHSLNEAPDAR